MKTVLIAKTWEFLAQSHAIQPGQQAITEQVIQRPAKYMQTTIIVLMGLTDLAGDGGQHSKIMLTVKEEQHLSALNVAVKEDCVRSATTTIS